MIRNALNKEVIPGVHLFPRDVPAVVERTVRGPSGDLSSISTRHREWSLSTDRRETFSLHCCSHPTVFYEEKRKRKKKETKQVKTSL